MSSLRVRGEDDDNKESLTLLIISGLMFWSGLTGKDSVRIGHRPANSAI